MHAVNVARRVCSNKRCTIMCFWFSICVSEGWSNSDCDMRAEKPHCRDCFPRPGTRRTTFWLHWASPENSGPLFAIVGMSPLPPLDEVLHAKILGYVTEPKACVSCQSWKQYLYDALKLEPRIRFMQRVKENGSVTFCYNAVRPLGEDFEESVGYTFNFFSDGIYRLAWTRTYDAWSSQGEQHYGKWAVDMDHVCCETLEPKVQEILNAKGTSNKKAAIFRPKMGPELPSGSCRRGRARSTVVTQSGRQECGRLWSLRSLRCRLLRLLKFSPACERMRGMWT
ncbi:unnamed protein product [Effrenium voratum]|nr:unnamed protein product [Effrenium voratum]